MAFRSMSVASIAGAVAIAGVVAVVSCLSPTEMTVVVTTDFPCSQLDRTTITVGTLGDALESSPPASTKDTCVDGYVGKLVVVPSGDKGELVAIKVIGGFGGKSAEDCTPKPGSSPPDYGTGCIVARRALRYTPHTPLTVDVVLRASCNGVACPATETCVAGACTSAIVSSPGDCIDANGCGEGSLGDGGARPDGTVPTDGGTDAPIDAPIDVVVPTFTPHPVAGSGVALSPTGLAQQVHVVYAEHDKRFWYFYVDDQTGVIKTRVSSDLVTWVDGDSISVSSTSSGGNGGNFSVAYANLGGADVIHIVISEFEPGLGVGYTFDIRATLTGAQGAEHVTSPVTTQLFPSSLAYVGGCDTDGPSIVVGADGFVYAATGWMFDSNEQTHCDMDVYRSSVPDNGGAWSASFAQTGYFVTSQYTSAHQLVALGSGRVIGAFPDHLEGTSFLTLAFARDVTGYDGDGGRQNADFLFDNAMGIEHGQDDWSLCRLSDTDVHAVRHIFDEFADAGPNAFQAMHYDGIAWTVEPTPPPIATPDLSSGLVLVSDPNAAHGMLAFTIGADGTTVSYSKWTPPGTGQGSWSAWTPFPGTSARRWLSGTGCGSVRPALFWREGADPGPYEIVGADVSGFLN